jgi:NADH-quinone oxidoreductase subunit E
MTEEVFNQIVDKYNEDKNALIQILLDIQNKFNWISKPAIILISERLGIPMSLIYQIATFYKVFSLTPRGRHIVRICLGTACHVRGGPKIMEAAERILGIKYGEVTSDGKFSLERVNCLGCCALGPVMVVDNQYHGNVNLLDVGKILSKYE